MPTSNVPLLSEVVQTKYKFTGFVQLDRSFEASYRRDCRTAFIPTETENKLFRAVARSAQGNLNQGKRNLLLVSPFGTGKTLNLVMVYDIFTSKGNTAAVQGFSQAVRDDLLGLTSQGPYLVVPVVGTESSMPLSQAILKAFQKAVAAHPLLKEISTGGKLLAQLEYEEAARWIGEVNEGTLAHLREPLGTFLRDHPTGHSIFSIGQALKEYDAVALDAWREGVQAVTGQPPHSYGAATPRDVFDRAMPELREQGIVGIALLVDELSQYLRLNPQYEAQAIITLDQIVHWIHSSDTSFSIVATQVVPEWLHGETQADHQAWASLHGRFQIVHMDRQRYDELIAGALERVSDPPTDPDKHPQMTELYEAHMACFPGREDRAKAQQAVAKYYPFHPTVIASLGSVADTLGQYERSIFQYLDRSVEGGFKDFIAAHPIYIGPASERLNLVTLDEIFRFFQDPSKLEAVNDSLAQAVQRAKAATRDDLLASRVVDLVALLAYLENRAPIPSPTLEALAGMLNVPLDDKLETVLARLVEEEHFTFDETLGYGLAVGSGPRPGEIRNAIRTRLASMDPVTSTEVLGFLGGYQRHAHALQQRKAPPFPIDEKYEVRVKNLTKQFAREFATTRQLVEQASRLRKGDTLAGRLFVGIVAEVDDADGRQYQAAVNAAGRLAQAGAVVALPRQAVGGFARLILRYKAAKAVADDTRLGMSSVAKLELESALHEMLSTLSSRYQPEELDWYTSATPAIAVHYNEVLVALGVAAQKLTEKFPDLIEKPDVAGGSSRSEVITHLLNGAGPVELRGLPGRVYTAALEPLGIVTIGPKTKDPKQTVKLAVPRDDEPHLAASAHIWGLVAAALPPGRKVGGEELYKDLQVLQRPPYWCPENLVVYLLAAYMGSHRAEVRDPRDASSSFRVPGVEDVKALVVRRSNLEVLVPKRTKLSDTEVMFIESLAKSVAATLPVGATAYAPSNLDTENPEVGLAKVGEDLGRWYRDHGAYALDLISRYDLCRDEVRGFLQVIAEAAMLGITHLQAASLYTSTLPKTLQAPAKQTPLIVEQTITGLTALATTRAQIDRAASMRSTSQTVATAWSEFVDDSLNRDSQEALLRAVKEAEAGIGSDLYHPAETRAQDFRVPTEQPNGAEGRRAASLVLTVGEMRQFADFVLAAAQQVQTGQLAFSSLEDLIKAFRTGRSASISVTDGGNAT